MALVSHIVELRHHSTLLFFSKVSVVVYLRLINIASVEATCLFSMLTPCSETNPAKVVFTQTACHMIAPVIFFNRRFAIRVRTFFSVSEKVCSVFVIRKLFPPSLNLLATTNFVRVVTTKEAEDCATRAHNIIELSVLVFLLNDQLA